MFSCDSRLPAEIRVPSRVGFLCTTDARGVGYDDLSLGRVLNGPPADLVDRLEAEITKRADATP